MINAAHWHVLLNHIPIIGLPMVALLLAWGVARANDAVIRLALIATVLMGAATWVVVLTGTSAAEEVKAAKYAWVKRDVIEEHEEAGEKAEIAAIVTGVLALTVLVIARGGKPPHRRATLGVLLGLGISAVLLGWTGWEGGGIRHDEFVANPTAAQPPIPRETTPTP